MGFRIHKGIWQFKNASNEFVNKYKLDSDTGELVATDADGNRTESIGGGGAAAWADITGKPTTFSPSSHTHDYLASGGKAADSNLLDGIDSGAFLRSNTTDSIGARLTMGTQTALVAGDYGHGVYGRYSATKYQHVWGMGTSYNMASNGDNLGNFYGLAYTHQNKGGESISGLNHQLLFVTNGDTRTAVGDGIWTKYGVQAARIGINSAPRTDSYKLSINGSIYMQNNNIDYINQLHFHDNIRFFGAGNDSLLYFKVGDSNWGEMRFLNGSSTRAGAVYFDSSTNNFGLLNKDGQWAFRSTATGSFMYYDGSNKLETTSSGVKVHGYIMDERNNPAKTYRHSGSDFADGTIVMTDIPADTQNGASFILECTGKSYSGNPPFSFIVQGYLYNNTVINHSGQHIGYAGFSQMKIFQHDDGNLAFWWPRVSYWNSFEVNVRDAGGNPTNRVVNIGNSPEPDSPKKVTVNMEVTATQSWTDANFLRTTEKAADADLLDGKGWDSSGKNVRATEFYADNWFRNYNSGEGMYNQATTQHWYSDHDDWWNVAGGSSANGIRFRDEHGGTHRGAVYANSSNEVGILDAGLSWAIKHKNDVGTYFYTDGTTEEFRVGRDTISALYGTVETRTTKASWGGYSINGQYVFMSNHDNRVGIFNSTDNEWMIQAYRNADVRLYYNGSLKLQTNSGGVTVTGAVSTSSHGDSSEWSAAYNWGDHRDAGYVTSSGNTIIGTDSDINTEGYNIIDNLYMTDGVITSHGTRQLTNLRVEDTRAAEKSPDDYEGYALSLDFTDKIHSGWHSALTMQGWHNGYAAWQLIGGSNTSAHENLYFRSGVGASWGTKRRIWHSGDFASSDVTNWGTAYTHSQAAHAPSNAEANVQSDWNATSGDAFIKNKPTIPTDTWRPIGTGASDAAAGNHTHSGYASTSHNHSGVYQPAGTYNTVIGTDADINTSGATIIDNLYMTDGVITSHGTRTLSAGDIGAATSGHTHSNYYTHNSLNNSNKTLAIGGNSGIGDTITTWIGSNGFTFISNQSNNGWYPLQIHDTAVNARGEGIAAVMDGYLVANGSWFPSDERLKTNIVSHDTSSCLTKINALRLVDYDKRAGDGKPYDMHETGFIAQEAELVDANFVSDYYHQDDDVRYKTVNYSLIYNELVGAVQEQQKTIDSLLARIEQLESK